MSTYQPVAEAEEAYKQDCVEQYVKDWIKLVAKYLGVDVEVLASEQMIQVLWVLYDEACRYYGVEEAYISTEDMPRLIESCRHELNTLGDLGNAVAAQLLGTQNGTL